MLILPILIFSQELFIWLGQDELTASISRRYLWSFTPGIFMIGISEIEKTYLTTFERSDISFYCVMLAPFGHYALSYLFVIRLQMGVCGLGLSIFLTRTATYAIQYYQMSRLEELKECNKVKLFEKRNIRNIPEYLKLAFPNIFLLMFEWSS